MLIEARPVPTVGALPHIALPPGDFPNRFIATFSVTEFTDLPVCC
jgi:hypothetical protein